MLGYAYSNGEYVKVFKTVNGESMWDENYDDNDPNYTSNAPPKPNSRINAIPAESVDWEDIPPRPWLTGTRLLRGFVSVLAGRGGVGKTALTITTALSSALGKNLLNPSNSNPHWQLHDESLKVYIYSLEDDFDEMKRRVKAVMNFHGINPRALDGRVVFGDGSVNRLIIAVRDAKGLTRTECVDRLIDYLIEHQIDILILDPLVKLHYCNENDNGEMDFVMVILKEIAIKANCAIWVIHHSGKSGTSFDETGARGASAIPSAARVSETLTPANKDDHNKFGFGRDMVKLESPKMNMSAHGDDDTQWLRISGHPVGNGDYAQVIELVAAKNQTERMDEVLYDGICTTTKNDPTEGSSPYWSTTRSSKNWIGYAFMMGGIHTEDRAVTLIQDWLKRGLLVLVADAKDQQGRPLKTAVKLDEGAAMRYRAEHFSG